MEKISRREQLLKELQDLENSKPEDLGIQKDKETDDEAEDEPPQTTTKAKKPRTEAQMKAFEKAKETARLNAEKRKAERDAVADAERKAVEEKLVKKAIALKKKQIKQQAVLDEIEDDDTPLPEIERIVKAKSKKPVKDLHRSIPELLLDNTDRNRTSPFAFTGNKFEFRAVGSTANCGHPMTILNTIVADTLNKFAAEVEALMEKGDKKEIAIMQVIQKYIVSSKKILFEGDGYSEEWHKEAEKRGLPNLKTTPIALDAMVTEKAKKLFQENNIYSHSELEARYEIELEKYIKKVQIEARIMGDLATNHIIPSALKYQNELLKNVSLLREAALPEKLYKGQLALLKDVSTHIQQVYDNVDAMVEERKVANNIANSRDKAIAYEAKVKAQYFDKIRYHVDKLEQLVDDELWTLPKYRELLFLR